MVGKAAEAAGIDRDYHYHWLKSDESYRTAFEQARQMLVIVLRMKSTGAVLRFDHPSYLRGQDNRQFVLASIHSAQAQQPTKPPESAISRSLILSQELTRQFFTNN
jgi:hypothetical protein